MKRSAILAWVLAVAVAVSAIGLSFHFDAAAREFIAAHASRRAWDCAQKVSKFGDWPAHLVLGALLAAGAWWRGSKKWTRVFIAMLIALTLAGAAARGLKVATARARPSVSIVDVVGRSHFSPKYHSFPSGHVAASSAFFAVLALANWRIGLPLLVIPLLIAWSRMYAGAHYLSDVVCAAALGAICAVLITRLALRKIDNPQSPSLQH